MKLDRLGKRATPTLRFSYRRLLTPIHAGKAIPGRHILRIDLGDAAIAELGFPGIRHFGAESGEPEVKCFVVRRGNEALAQMIGLFGRGSPARRLRWLAALRWCVRRHDLG